MSLGRFLERLLQLVPVLLGVSLIAFLMMALTPGDPVQIMIGDQSITPEQEAELRRGLGLDRPMVERFFIFLGNAVQFDFGTSFYHGRPVGAVIAERLPATIELSLVALVVALVTAIPLGVLAAIKKNSILDRLTPKAQHLVQIAQQNCKRLAGLVNDILDIEKLGADTKPITVSTIDLRSAIEEAIAGSVGYLPEREIVLKVHDRAPGAQVLANSKRLAQVLANLLSNAIKFSPRAGTIVVDLSRGKTGLCIAVQDQGPGVPPEFEPRLFSRFEQADTSNTRANRGTGLGLSISKALVHRMGGTIAYRRLGNRTEFTVTLPEAPAAVSKQRKPARTCSTRTARSRG